jgi:hypothetical protein
LNKFPLGIENHGLSIVDFGKLRLLGYAISDLRKRLERYEKGGTHLDQ